MRTRSRVDDCGSALAMVERVFALTTTEPTALLVRRNDLEPDLGEGLPGGPIPLPRLRNLLLSPGVPQATRDAVWRVLIGRARADGPSWLVATVGMALPGLRRQVNVLAGSSGVAREDLESAVVEGFIADLHRVDVTKRGLCGRLVRAGYRAGVRQVFTDAPFTGAAATGFASHAPQPPWGHPDFVLADAVAAGVLSRQEAWMIGVTRLEDVPVAVVAAELGEPANTIVARRRRAERCLRDAIAEGLASKAQDQTEGEPEAAHSAVPNEPNEPHAPAIPDDGARQQRGPASSRGPSCKAVSDGVTRPAGHPGLTRPPLRVGDLAPARGRSSIARGEDAPSAGRGHVSDLLHPGKEEGSPPSPRAITAVVGAAHRRRVVWR
jgi:hypothetical protein